MSYEVWNKKLEQLGTRFKEGQPIWFMRGNFVDPKFATPKWHLFANRERVEGKHAVYRWTALCGYRYNFWEVLLDIPRVSMAKQPPPRAERCVKCYKKL